MSEELNKIILSDHPSIGFQLLEVTGLLKIIFPEFQELKGVEIINGKAHKDNFYHTLKVLDNILPHSKGNLNRLLVSKKNGELLLRALCSPRKW